MHVASANSSSFHYLDHVNLSTKENSFRDDDGPNLKQKPSELGEGGNEILL